MSSATASGWSSGIPTTATPVTGVLGPMLSVSGSPDDFSGGLITVFQLGHPVCARPVIPLTARQRIRSKDSASSSLSCVRLLVRLPGRIQVKSDQFEGYEPNQCIDTILLRCYTSVTSISA